MANHAAGCWHVGVSQLISSPSLSTLFFFFLQSFRTWCPSQHCSLILLSCRSRHFPTSRNLEQLRLRSLEEGERRGHVRTSGPRRFRPRLLRDRRRGFSFLLDVTHIHDAVFRATPFYFGAPTCTSPACVDSRWRRLLPTDSCELERPRVRPRSCLPWFASSRLLLLGDLRQNRQE